MHFFIRCCAVGRQRRSYLFSEGSGRLSDIQNEKNRESADGGGTSPTMEAKVGGEEVDVRCFFGEWEGGEGGSS